MRLLPNVELLMGYPKVNSTAPAAGPRLEQSCLLHAAAAMWSAADVGVAVERTEDLSPARAAEDWLAEGLFEL